MIMPTFRPFFMWLLPLCFFAYQFILRQWPSLTMAEFMTRFQADAGDFGFFSAAYYVGYAGMQIPAALLLERYKSNLLISFFILIAAGSMALLLYAPNWPLALVGRFFIGVASAMGFLGTSFIVSRWFKPEHYGRMIGLSFSFGIMGAVYGGSPVSLLIDSHGVQGAGMMILWVGVALGVLTLLFLRNGPGENQDSPCAVPFQKEVVLSLLKNRSIMILAISNLLLVGSLEGFADVWGVNFLTFAYDISKTDAAGMISFIFLGMLIGGPILAFLSESLGPFKVIALCGLVMTAVFILLLYTCPWMSPMGLRSVLFMVGVCCCYQVIVFSACQRFVPQENLGIAVAFLNAINMLGGSFFHTAIGQAARYFWDGRLIEGCPLYSTNTLVWSLTVIPICALVGSFLVLLTPKNSIK
jgi:predicted MFS family arabinose efflux permease